MRASSGSFKLNDFSPATWTWQSLATKDPGEVHITPLLAFGVDVVSVATAAFFNSQVHDEAKFNVKLLEFVVGNRRDQSLRVNFSSP